MIQLVVCFVIAAASPGLPIRIDLGKDTGRSDTANPHWEEWQVPDGQRAQRDFGPIKITLRAIGESQEITGKWHKPGLATGAKIATDGISVENESGPAVLEISIAGLSPGRHSLVTYHNALQEGVFRTFTLGQSNKTEQQVTPTTLVTSNEAAASGYLEFDAQEGQPVVVRLLAARGGIILNGLEIDGSNPIFKATQPLPNHGDYHADADSGNITLSWKPSSAAEAHRVFVSHSWDRATALKECHEAAHGSPAYKDRVLVNYVELEVSADQLGQDFCWRVDSIDQAGNVTKGDVWHFRPRQLAFPGAEGYGRFAIGGRRGRVIKVTHLGDSGSGSLRAALEAEGPRTVIFDVSGRIVLESRLIIRNPFVTIAGQTAPGKGICISNYNLGVLGTHDCNIRFLRVRPGDTAGKTLDGMGLASTDHSIIDHCSISWSQDEAFSSRGAKNITLQRTLISEALNVAGHKKYAKGSQHGFAASIGGDIGSFHHNLLAHCAGRNWSLAGGIDQANVHAGRLDIRNNVVYNWKHRTTDGGARQVNFVNNYYKPGAASQIMTYLNPQFENPAFGPQQYFVEGNLLEDLIEPEGPTGVLKGVKPRGHQDASVTVSAPFFESHINTQTAEVAFFDVLADVGCNRPVLDKHDQRVIAEASTGTHTYSGSISGLPGLPDSQKDVGGWEDYPELSRSGNWDTDDDGLPNWWEKRHQLNPNSSPGDLTETHADPDGNGFTHLEEYLHWMAIRGNEVPQ